MNREFDPLLNHLYPNVKDFDELNLFLEDSVFSSVCSLPSGLKKQALTCLLLFICGYASPRELQFMIGPVFERGAGVNFYGHLLKGGHVESFSLPVRDFGSTSTLHVTDVGFGSYLSSISDDLKEGGGVNQKKRTVAQKSKKSSGEKGGKTASVVPFHDYGLGVSLLSLLCLRRCISIKKEVSFVAEGRVRTKGIMRTDAWVEITGRASSHPKTMIYLEQDMGTESTRQICNKIFAYADTRFLNPMENCIILSCYSASGVLNSGRFEHASVTRLVKVMEDYSFDDLFSLYEESEDDSLPLSRNELEKLLLSVGAAIRTPGGSIERAGGKAFSLSELKSYADALSLGNNQSFEKCVNTRLFMQAKGTFRSLCSYLYRSIYEKDYLTGFLPNALFGGYGIWVLPSTLLSNSADFYLRADGADRLLRYLKSVSGLFPDLPNYVYASQGLKVNLTVSNPDRADGFSEEDAPTIPVCFPNAYYSLYGGDYVCFEHLGRDVGAFMRLVALGRALNRGSLETDMGGGVHVIAVCDTIEDANALARLVDPMPYEEGSSSWFRFNFLFEHTCDGSGSSPLFEFNKPHNFSSGYLEPLKRLGAKNQPPSAAREVLSYSLSEFSR